ncbi:hypothetical protein OJ997_31225 [Solirubrobacter phytolaccae]|uniref:Uncharacterized protein n=1 Tax=Solirubrobacter phytolaccae TaxID=1404360 RepID=A0A9X3NF00_9ACTN|nr:hypothetical protein [Solirubrobacter phytolaccae]MDA0184816.1 hypothetical protein [Solirubrobacter phytolaccae]
MSGVAVFFLVLMVFVAVTGLGMGLALVHDVGGFASWVVERHRRHEARTRSANGYSIPSLQVARQKGQQLVLFGLLWEVVLLVGVVISR